MDILRMPKADIARMLEDRIRAEYPGLNIIKGSPVYDLMVNRLAGTIETYNNKYCQSSSDVRRIRKIKAGIPGNGRIPYGEIFP